MAARDEFPPLPAGTVFRGVGSPFALVKRGGEQRGKRPYTALAVIVHMYGTDGGRQIHCKALIKRGNGYTKPRPVAYRDIVRAWREPPLPATVAATRRGLKPVGEV